ncbi:tetratricopeptide repeat-containing serine/threonine-protein kinase [Melittangium boletus]|uniref:Serine/threonine kinase family protein n=1 Tax=Melittangium boletus DSM 14713 TaxID=1294270 RepID=A0A250IIM1_9BACT|nr:tetratricopeptide repeat-containing serine/threonine-protein kinase [Melittangium boletus]ATB31022.1 Serine/threonine kinase family protein [Melittangium boletus DSM 14713]
MSKSDDRQVGSVEPDEEKTEAAAPPPPRSARSGASSSNTGESAGRNSRRPPPDRQVGRFIPLKVLGQGGMGVVYAAYDPDLDRKVALKLLLVKDEGTDLQAGKARLMREAQAMARVSHPHVIPVFEVGTWGDQVFVAMELVEGGTLREWSQARPRSWREVLEKYLAAGQGLAAAHAAGLVHRDFKPANVLVGHNGRVYVTDFGLARQVAPPEQARLPSEEDTLPPESVGASALAGSLTLSGVVLGTPRYMSPEQFRGDALDARSDQFSFCAALYMGLYGSRPFEPERMSRAARHSSRALSGPPSGGAGSRPLHAQATASIIQEPPRDAKVPAWVRRAVMRGLSLEPSERFDSMEALLTALSQEQRLARRRRWLGAAALGTLALTAAGGAVVWRSRVCAGGERLMSEVWGGSAHDQVRASFLKSGGPLAEQMFQRAAGVLDGYASSWTRQHTEACEATRLRGERSELLWSQQVVCLERRREDMRALVKVLGAADRKGVEKSLDAVYALSSPEDCANLEALAELQPRPADPTRRAQLESLEARLGEVKALLDVSHYPEALAQARQLAPQVEATGYLPLMAEQRFHEGWLQALLGEKQEGARLLEQAVYDATTGRADRLEVSILNKLLYVTGERKHYEDAERWARLGEATVRRLGGDAVLESDLLANRANVALMRGKPELAVPLMEKASSLLEGLPPGHPKRARMTFNHGRALLELGETERAVAILKEALRQTEAAVGPQHLDTARRHQALAMALMDQKHFEEGLTHARASAAGFQSLGEVDPIPLSEALDMEGMCFLGLKRYEEALRVYQEALSLKQRKLAPDDELLQYSHDGVGQALLGLGRTREAVSVLRRALAFTSAPDEVLADTGFALANALWKEGQGREARVEAARAQERFTQAGKSQRAAEVQAWMTALAP